MPSKTIIRLIGALIAASSSPVFAQDHVDRPAHNQTAAPDATLENDTTVDDLLRNADVLRCEVERDIHGQVPSARSTACNSSRVAPAYVSPR
jgi:hypothetical protein